MTPIRPPRLAEWLLTRSLAPGDRDAVLGDLHEELDAIASETSRAIAARWYWRQTLASIGPNIRRRVTGHCRRHNPGRHQPPHERPHAMDSLLLDIRYAWRMLQRRPLLSAVALASLAIGTSLSTVVFSLLNAAVLRPLPVQDPDRLALVLEQRASSINHNLSYPDFVDYRASQRTFVDLAAHTETEVMLRRSGEARVVSAELVSGELFSLLGIRMLAGRPLLPADDRPEAPPALVLSESMWRDLTTDASGRFESKALTVNGQSFTIVGVAAAPFRGMQIGRDVRVWIPLARQDLLNPSAASLRARRQVSWLSLIGRLQPGVTLAEGAADLNRVEATLAPSVGGQRPRTFVLAAGRQGDSRLPQSVRSPLGLLLGAGLLVLLVACANVANLLLARSTQRTREMAVRTALGAARTRLARLVIVEALMIGVAGAAIAVAVAPLVARLVVPFMGDFGEPVTLDVAADWRVIVFAAILALATTTIAGLAPVVGTLRGVRADALAEGGRGTSAGPAARRFRHVLVAAQFALSLALVAVALLLSRTVSNLRALPTGLDLDHVALFSVDPEAARYDGTRSAAYIERALARLAALPGVNAAGYGRIAPLGFGGSRRTVQIQGYVPAPDEDMELNFNVVSPSYRAALGIEMRAGRWFQDSDASTQPLVVVVNETMARRYWPNGSAVGARLRFEQQGPDVEVLGVARDVKYRMLREEAAASFYVPLGQSRATFGVLHVRTAGPPAALLTTLRQTLQQADANVPVTDVRTLREQAEINLKDERLAMVIALVLGGAALLLAAVGLYGSMAFAVGQRTREIGVRVALGATSSNVRHLVLGDGLKIAAIGTSTGIGLALLLSRAIEARLFGVTAADPLTLVASASVLTLVALAAGYAPARRATQIDPVDALRSE